MKSARKMFNELGFKYKKTASGFEYLHSNGSCSLKVLFDERNHDLYVVDNQQLICLDMPTLKAINKQIEELGWLDE